MLADRSTVISIADVIGACCCNFFTVAMSIADDISVCCYCDSVIFTIKKMTRSHSGSILNVLHMFRKLMR
jgi:hypothetical protein